MKTAPRTGFTCASTSAWSRAVCLSMVGGVACVSPDTFVRTDGGDQTGAGGSTTGSGAGGNRTGSGNGGTGAGGAGASGSGGRVGSAGTTGAGGTIIGPAANLTETFETDGVDLRWIWDSPTGTKLVPSGTPCGDWTVVSDTATNHVFQQGSNCTGNPSWAAGGSRFWTDMRLQAKVRFGAGATTSTKITIGVRLVNDRSQYYVEYGGIDGKLKIRKKDELGSGGDVASLASKLQVPVQVGQWVTVGLSVSGTTLNAYLGEDRTAAPVLTGTADGMFTAGGIALGAMSGTASFDDVLVTPP